MYDFEVGDKVSAAEVAWGMGPTPRDHDTYGTVISIAYYDCDGDEVLEEDYDYDDEESVRHYNVEWSDSGERWWYEDYGGYIIPYCGRTYERSVENDKAAASALLAKVKPFCPWAVVAGGAPAGWKRGEVCKDIDLFLSAPAGIDKRQVMEHMRGLIGTHVRIRGDHYNPESTDKIQYVLEGRYEGVKFQLIFIAVNPQTVINTFPFSHTAVSWTEDGYVTTSMFDLFESFQIVCKLGECDQPYTDKVRQLIADKGWELTDNPMDALDKASGQLGLDLDNLPEPEEPEATESSSPRIWLGTV